MADIIKDILAALGVLLNGLPQGLLALAYGFASVPTALGFGVGIIGCLLLSSVVPISFQAETITLAGTMGRTLRERLSMVFFAGLIMAVLGLFGLLKLITDFAGDIIVAGMMAGVGIMLARVAIDMVKQNKIVGGVSLGVGLIVYLLTQNQGNQLVYTIIASVVVSSVAGYLCGQRPDEVKAEQMAKFRLQPPTVNFNVVRGTLALTCLTVGANIAFGNITGSIAGVSANIDHLTIYSGLADSVSSLFGGGPVEAIISATAAAPHAQLAGILMMGLMAVVLFLGLLPKIGKFVPAQSIAGFLFVLGAFVTVPIDGAMAFAGPAGTQVLGGVTMVVTAIVDPFVGMVAGILLKLVLGL